MGEARQGHPVSGPHVGARPRKARPLRLAPHISGASAFRRITLACLEHLVANEPAAIDGVDSEGVHQARVAIRRLRSALVLFQDYAGISAALDFRERLRDAGRALGEARDWDVFLAETLPAYLGQRPEASIGSIIPPATRLRAVGHRLVRKTLSDPAHRRFLAELHGWIEGDAWRSGLGLDTFRALDQPCREIAGRLLDRAANKVRRRGAGIGHLTPEERHELRKAMKRLRYGAEFLASLYPPKKVQRYLAAAERLQDVLGKLNDAAGIVALTERPSIQRAGDRAELSALREWAAADSARNLVELEEDWAQFERAEPFWG